MNKRKRKITDDEPSFDDIPPDILRLIFTDILDGDYNKDTRASLVM